MRPFLDWSLPSLRSATMTRHPRSAAALLVLASAAGLFAMGPQTGPAHRPPPAPAHAAPTVLPAGGAAAHHAAAVAAGGGRPGMVPPAPPAPPRPAPPTATPVAAPAAPPAPRPVGAETPRAGPPRAPGA